MKLVCKNFRTKVYFSFEPKCAASAHIAKSICSSLKFDTKVVSACTKSEVSASDSKLLVEIATTDLSDLRAYLNAYIRLINMAYLSLLD